MDANHRCQESTTPDESPDPEALRRQIRLRGTEIKRREVETALDRLEAENSLSEPQRAVVVEMADRITHKLLAAPTAALEDADRHADPDELAALACLFASADD
jgi:glutamyl-tRNA reductase